MERNGVIYMWYDDENKPPTWEVPQAKGLDTWWFRCDGKSAHEISAHIQVRFISNFPHYTIFVLRLYLGNP
jgi:hypothetical protein